MAADELVRDGFEIFFPCIKTPQPRTGHADIPLFPGYLFLRFDPCKVRWPLFSLRHRMFGLVRFGEEAAWLPDETITELTDRLEDLNHDSGLWPRYHAGDRVEVISNGVESLAEVLEDAQSPQSRVKVLLEFMGRLVPAQVPWQDLKPAEEDPSGNQPGKARASQGNRRGTRGKGRWIQGQGSRVAGLP